MSASDGTSSPPGSPRLPPARITRAEWGLILVLVAIQFTHMVDFVIIMPLGGRLMTELSLNPEQFSYIVSAYAWAAGIASLLASFVMDRFDRKAVLVTMYAGFTFSTLFCGLSNTYEWLLVSRTLAGAFGGTAAVALMAVIGDIFPPEKRGRASGAVISSFAVASILGLPAGLLLTEWFARYAPMAPEVLREYRATGAPFVALAFLSAAVWALAWLQLPAIRGHLTAKRPNRFAEFAEVVSHRDHLGAFAFVFFLVLGTFTVASFLGPYFSKLNGWKEDKLSQIYFVAGLCTLVGTIVVGRLSDRLPRLALFRVLGFGALVMAIVLTHLPPGPLWVVAVAASAFMVFAAGRMIPVQAMLLGVPHPKNRGAFMSVYTTVQHVATGLAPIIAGALVYETPDGHLEGFPAVGWVAAVTALISLALAGLLKQAKVEAPKPTEAEVATDPSAETKVEATEVTELVK
jgi:MFS transporter, DHA1 family, inner membrane transport protein